MARKLRRMLSLAERMLGDPAEAEDVAQEVFFRVWRHAPRWRPGAARFDTWLHRVTLNLCYDRLRRRRERPTPIRRSGRTPARRRIVACTPRTSAGACRPAMQALPPRQREAIVLCHYQELGNIEAAGVMGISVEALESLLSRGRRALKAALADLADGASGD